MLFFLLCSFFLSLSHPLPRAHSPGFQNMETFSQNRLCEASLRMLLLFHKEFCCNWSPPRHLAEGTASWRGGDANREFEEFWIELWMGMVKKVTKQRWTNGQLRKRSTWEEDRLMKECVEWLKVFVHPPLSLSRHVSSILTCQFQGALLAWVMKGGAARVIT